MSHVAPDAGERFGWEGMKDVPPFVEGDKHYDPTTAGWKRRRDDPNVVARMEHLQANAGIKGLEICEPHEVEKAARIFHRDGFVAVKDCLSPEILARMRATTDRAIMQAIESGPPRSSRHG